MYPEDYTYKYRHLGSFYKGPSPQSRLYCGTCNNMTKKELRRYDSCPECGKSLYSRKQGIKKGWWR